MVHGGFPGLMPKAFAVYWALRDFPLAGNRDLRPFGREAGGDTKGEAHAPV
jgi:hypothetical protein